MMDKMGTVVILVSFLSVLSVRAEDELCDPAVQSRYCSAWYGGDYHTACQRCGRGATCPQGPVASRGITQEMRNAILQIHNRHQRNVYKASCLPSFEWDDELAEVGQVWADQCAMVFYPKTNPFPKIFHEKSGQRTTSRFGHPPGIGQNVAWVLTNKNDTFSDYIKDLWFRDTRYESEKTPRLVDVTQMRRENFTHVGCGWLQIEVGKDKWALEKLSGEFENFIVCNYAKSKNIQAASIECSDVVDSLTNTDSNESGPPSVSSMSIDPETKEPENLREGTKNPFLMDQRIDLSAISKSTLQEFVNFVLPHLDDLQEQTIIENLQSHGGIISVENLENILLNMKIKPKKKLDSVQDKTVQTTFSEEIENRSIFEDDISIKEHEACLRRYMERVNQTNISYYNSTTRTQVLTAICLEGIKCNSNEDDRKCLPLHKMCNQHINTSKYSFSMRVTLSECTLEDILCHLGHQTPVMCCQDKYSECVTQLNSDKGTLNGVGQTDSSFVIDSVNSSYDEAKLPITNEIIFSEDSPPFIIQNPGDFFANPDQDEDTLRVFQNYTLVIDDSQDFNSEIFREGNIQDIISGLNSNSTDYKIIFDPNSTVISSNVGGQEEQISNILNLVNRAIQSTLNICSERVCIENQELNKASSPEVGEEKGDEIEMRSRKQAITQKENQTLIGGESNISLKNQPSSNKDINGNFKNLLTSGKNKTNLDVKVHIKTNDEENFNQTSLPLEEENILLFEQEGKKQTHLPSGTTNKIPYMNQTSLLSNSEVFEDSHQPPEENKKNSVQTTSNGNYKKVPLNIKENNEVTTERGYSTLSPDVQYEASDKEKESQNSETQQLKDEFSILNIVREEGPNILADMFNVIKESVANEIERQITAAKKAESSSISSVNLDLETDTEFKIELLTDIKKDLSEVKTRIPQNKREKLHQNQSVNELVEENSKLEHAREKPPKENEATETTANPDTFEGQELLGESPNLGNLAINDDASVEGIKGAVVNEQDSSQKGKGGQIFNNQLTNQESGPSNDSNNNIKTSSANLNPTIGIGSSILSGSSFVGLVKENEEQNLNEKIDKTVFSFGIDDAMDFKQDQDINQEGQINPPGKISNNPSGTGQPKIESGTREEEYNKDRILSDSTNYSLGASTKPKSSSNFSEENKDVNQILAKDNIEQTIINFGVKDALDQAGSEGGHESSQDKESNNSATNQGETGPNKIVTDSREEESDNKSKIFSPISAIDQNDSFKFVPETSTKTVSSIDFSKEEKIQGKIFSNYKDEQAVTNFGLQDSIESKQSVEQNVHNDETMQPIGEAVATIDKKEVPITPLSSDSIDDTKKTISSILESQLKVGSNMDFDIKDSNISSSSNMDIDTKQESEKKDSNISSSSNMDIDIKQESEKKDSNISSSQKDSEFREKDKGVLEKAFENQEEHENSNQNQNSISRGKEKQNQVVNDSSIFKEEFYKNNNDRMQKPVYKTDTSNITFDPEIPNKTWEEVKASTESDNIQNPNNNGVSKNQSSDSHMAMSLPSFGFNITFEQSKVKPILQENNNSMVFEAEKVKLITNEKYDDVNTSKTSDNTIIHNTLSKENIPILNERLNVSVEIMPEIEEKSDEDLGVTKKIVTKNNTPRRSDDIVNIIKDIVYEQISDSESKEEISSSQNQLFQTNKPYNNRKRMRNSLQQDIEVEEVSELQEFRKGIQGKETQEEILNPENFIDQYYSASVADNVIQGGNLFADSLYAGVTNAKVVEDFSYSRSLKSGNVGLAIIMSIVIAVLATICFSVMIILVIWKRRKTENDEIAVSSMGTSTSQFSFDNSYDDVNEMKATYREELPPNISVSDVQSQDVLVPMDGHLTIIRSYEEFLDVPAGARPNLLQGLPVSQTTLQTEPVNRRQFS